MGLIEVQVVTFDKRGLSGHLNHICVHRGVRRYMQDERYKSEARSICFFELVGYVLSRSSHLLRLL